MSTEEWKTVPGFERYEVSSLGRIRSGWFNKPRICHGALDCDGYRKFILINESKSRKTVRVAKLIAETFNGKVPDGMEVSHVNGIRDDDRLDNLEYKTHQSNIGDKWKHGTMARGVNHGMVKLAISDVLAIRKESGKLLDIANKYGISFGHVSNIKAGREWKWLQDPQ